MLTDILIKHKIGEHSKVEPYYQYRVKKRLHGIIFKCLNIKLESDLDFYHNIQEKWLIIFYIIQDPAIWMSTNVLTFCNTAILLHWDASLDFNDIQNKNTRLIRHTGLKNWNLNVIFLQAIWHIPFFS